MASVQIIFCLMCLFLGATAQTNYLKLSSSVQQEPHFISAKSGGSVTLHCYDVENAAARFHWYKQTLGEKPRLISIFYKTEKIFLHFDDDFNNSSRFRLDNGKGKNHLIISDLRISDSATYYCIRSYLYTATFSETIIVNVNDLDLNIQALVHQSASETLQPGGSVTLHCTVHSGPCDGDHRVYWFKDAEESHPGLIYTRGGTNDECERNPNTQTHTCVYNLPIESPNESHAGLYYCAVALCGRLLFGNGTKLDFEDEQGSPVLVYFLSAALTLTTIISVLSTFLVFKMNKNNSCRSTVSKANDSVNLENTQVDNLHYAAVRKTMTKGARRHRSNTKDECVYSSIKHTHQTDFVMV